MKNELNELIKEEKAVYFANSKTEKRMRASKHKRYYIFMFLYHFRYCQYYRKLRNSKQLTFVLRYFYKWAFRYHEKQKNIYSYKSGVEIGLDSQIGKCCDIWHSGVVINGIVGDHCVFHGNNTIGNKGIGKDFLRPNIGNNVDIGVGAIIIGDINIADGCKIGAGAVVTKSFNEPESTIIGVPGKAIIANDSKEK